MAKLAKSGFWQEAVLSALTVVKNTSKFVMAQAPDVAREIVLHGRVLFVFHVFVLSVLAVLSVVGMCSMYYIYGSFTLGMSEGAITGHVFLFILVLILTLVSIHNFIVLMQDNTSKHLYAVLSPKVYFIREASKFLGGDYRG